MKKPLFILFAALPLMWAFHYGILSSSQPPVERTGAPDEGSCADCHGNTTGNGDLIITSNVPDNIFAYGQTYTINITIADDVNSQFGFSMTALDQNNQPAGTFTLINTMNTTLQNSNNLNRWYVGHKNAMEMNTWTFQWKAPESNQGVESVTLFAKGNAANNNGATSGDFIYTKTASLIPENAATENILTNTLRYSAHNNILNLYIAPKKSGTAKISCYTLSGQQIWTQEYYLSNQLNHIQHPVDRGIFILSIEHNHHRISQKIIHL